MLEQSFESFLAHLYPDTTLSEQQITDLKFAYYAGVTVCHTYIDTMLRSKDSSVEALALLMSAILTEYTVFVDSGNFGEPIGPIQ